VPVSRVKVREKVAAEDGAEGQVHVTDVVVEYLKSNRVATFFPAAARLQLPFSL
jgi:hypothetical protein